MPPIMDRRSPICAATLFIVLIVAMLVFSYRDQRPVDGNLEWGSPLVFYVATAGFGSPPVAEVNALNLIGNGIVYLIISVILAYPIARKWAHAGKRVQGEASGSTEDSHGKW